MLNALSVKCFTQRTGMSNIFPPWNPLHSVVKVQSVRLGFCFPVFDPNGGLLTRSVLLYREITGIGRLRTLKISLILPIGGAFTQSNCPTIPLTAKERCGGSTLVEL